MKISIVLPNYNGAKLLEKNLKSVIDAVGFYEKERKEPSEIIIVDDGSSDGSVLYISSLIKENKNLRLIKNTKNLGFSSTVNKGVKEASGDIVVLLNTDCRPEINFLIPLRKDFADDKVFGVGLLDKSVEGGKTILRGRGIGKWEKGFLIHNRGEVDKNNTLWISGGSGAFRKSIWEKLGGMNELYNPFYWEDVDISYRALKSGYIILFEQESIVVHEHESGVIKKKFAESQVKTIAYRNQFIFVWENITDLDLQFLHLLYIPYNFVWAMLNKEWEFIFGFFKAFLLLPKIIRSSFKAQKLFVKSDKEVIIAFKE